MKEAMRVFCWNVQGRVEPTLGRQLRRVLERRPDVIALQELTVKSYPGWRDQLEDADYSVLSTERLIGEPYPEPPYEEPPFPPPRGGGKRGHIRRTNFNLIAARHPIDMLDGLSFPDAGERRFAFPEKYLAARVELYGATLEVHNAHVPPGASRGVLKVHAFEAIRRRVDTDEPTPRILCGDFNAPWEENADGPVTKLRKWPEEIARRWRDAETALLANPDMRDVYRDVHKQGTDFPVSHWTGRKRLTPHRYDYVFASPELETISCEYVSDWLERNERGWRLSDHAPVVADLALRAVRQR